MSNNVTLYKEKIDIKEETYTVTTSGTSSQANSFDKFFTYSNNNFATFENTGIDLLDESLELASSSSDIGFVSSNVVDSTGTIADVQMRLQMLSTNSHTFDKGITIQMYHQESIKSSIGEIQFIGPTGLAIESVPLYPGYNEPTWQFNIGSNGLGIYIRTRAGTVTTTEPYCFVGVKSIFPGKIEAAEDIIGEISIYGEAKFDCTDAPAGTCDVTVMTETAPEEGESIVVETPNYSGRYIIENVSREARNIYSLQCYDYLQNLDGYNVVPESYSADYKTYTQLGYTGLLGDSKTSWSDLTGIDVPVDGSSYSVDGYISKGTTCRQAIAMYSLSLGKGVTAFGDTEGIHLFSWRGNQANYKAIPDYQILGYATYEKQGSYSDVAFVYTDTAGTETRVTADTTEKSRLSLGSYEFTDSTLYCENSGVSTVNAQHIANYINGDKVTATIVYEGEKIGDWVKINTQYNGEVLGIIESIQITAGCNKSIADIVIRKAVG